MITGPDVIERFSHIENDIDPESIYAIHAPSMVDLRFSPTGAGHFWARSDYSVSRNNLNMMLVIFTVSGCGYFDYHGKTFLLPPQHAVMIDGMDFHHYRTADGCACWEFKWMRFATEDSAPYERVIERYDNPTISVENHEFEPILDQYIRKINACNEFEELELSCLIVQSLTMLCQQIQCRTERTMDELYLVRSIQNHIHKHYAECITLDQLAAESYVSRYSLIRKFQKVTGYTPYAYLQKVRINEACVLLEKTHKSVAEISYLVGFNSQNNFTKQFRALQNKTPCQHRSQFITAEKL